MLFITYVLKTKTFMHLSANEAVLKSNLENEIIRDSISLYLVAI